MSQAETMRRDRDRAVLACLLLALAAGCGGAGGSSSPGGPTAPQPMILFSPDRAPAGPGFSMRAGSGTTATSLALEIPATDVADVLTVDFTLDYPGDLLQLTGFRQGAFLGTDASVVLAEASGGSFTALITSAGGSGASGGGVIVIFEFQAVASGGGRIDFVAPEASDSFGAEIEGLDWIGGAVQVVL